MSSRPASETGYLLEPEGVFRMLCSMTGTSPEDTSATSRCGSRTASTLGDPRQGQMGRWSRIHADFVMAIPDVSEDRAGGQWRPWGGQRDQWLWRWSV